LSQSPSQAGHETLLTTISSSRFGESKSAASMPVCRPASRQRLTWKKWWEDYELLCKNNPQNLNIPLTLSMSSIPAFVRASFTCFWVRLRGFTFFWGLLRGRRLQKKLKLKKEVKVVSYPLLVVGVVSSSSTVSVCLRLREGRLKEIQKFKINEAESVTRY